MDSIITRLDPLIKASGFDHYGWAELKRPFSIAIYESWIKDGQHGSMEYLARHLPLKAEPQKILSQARSALVIATPYFPHPKAPAALEHGRLALYAQGEDYHLWFKNELEKLKAQLQIEFPDEHFVCFTDSGPVLERDLAARAGLGWIGKNTCLIHTQKGSLFFIGEIFTTLPIQTADVLHPDRCGTCTRCLDICPTKAIESPRKLNATKCISYWTIESKTPAPEPLRAQIGDWLFGCDLCQTVCPWNEKAFGPTMKTLTTPTKPNNRQDLIKELRHILQSSNKELEKQWKDTPLERAGGRGLKKNAVIVAANLTLTELKSDIEQLQYSTPQLQSLCDWALSKI